MVKEKALHYKHFIKPHYTDNIDNNNNYNIERTMFSQ